MSHGSWGYFDSSSFQKICLLKCSELFLIASHPSIIPGRVQLWFFHFPNILLLIRWPARGKYHFLIINYYYFSCTAMCSSCLTIVPKNMPWSAFYLPNSTSWLGFHSFCNRLTGAYPTVNILSAANVHLYVYQLPYISDFMLFLFFATPIDPQTIPKHT